jgi:DNA recombination protein RmuC
MAEMFGARQADLARVMADRLDNVSARVGAGLESAAQTTGANLTKLNERLAVIDAAQGRLTSLAQEVVSLKDILANKQTRGAFGQGRMEAIVRDGLPSAAYDFQYTLSNKSRPDCVIWLPGDERGLAVDAKFPLEAFSLFRDARSDEARKVALARVRADVGKHVKDIGERYLLAGETQDLAMMFVPSESIYSDLVEHFDDIVQKAHRGRIMIVSPSLLMMAIQVMQTVVRDARMRDQAHVIQDEVAKLLDDVRRLAERTGKLDQHFRQAQEDVGQIAVSSEKIAKRGESIKAMEFAPSEPAPSIDAPPHLRLTRRGE